MIQIDQTIISTEIFDTPFICDIAKCKGMCCVYGDSGAPLEDEEILELEHIYDQIKPYMTQAGIDAVEKQGLFLVDDDDDKVTPLVNGAECVYTCSEDGIVSCAIEKAYRDGKINFQKPLSCHLYPIRISKYPGFEAINYHQWNVCGDALNLGKQIGTPLYIFLQEPLIRKYGKEWFDKLSIAAEQFSVIVNKAQSPIKS